ncbi:hypothetical protein GH714_026557 [Hevea brasiliensis]|uniref:PB1-like domain-containing protein n=1 Tax=Hevea brasiliensis TaxID=3981 RepID=A0A6A6NDJ7_HEVBR|nr:hypothetical protein GH714_026557 [Hevea brasiliensis]
MNNNGVLHHDGVLRELNGSFVYKGGYTSYMDNLGLAKVRYFDIKDALKKFCYVEIKKLANFRPRMDSKNGIRYVRIYNDNDVLEMLKWDEDGDVYVEAEYCIGFEGCHNVEIIGVDENSCGGSSTHKDYEVKDENVVDSDNDDGIF